MVSSSVQHVVVAEPAQRESDRPALAVERREQLAQRMVDGDVGVAERAEDAERHRPVGEDDVAEQLDRRSIGPVEVVEHEEHRALGGGPFEQVDHALEEHEPLRLGVERRGRLGLDPTSELRHEAEEVPPRSATCATRTASGACATSCANASIHGWYGMPRSSSHRP